MKKILFILLFSFLFSVHGYGESLRPYFGVKGGFSLVGASFELGHWYEDTYYHRFHYIEDDYSSDAVFSGSAFIGMRVMRNLRFEFEYTHKTTAEQSFEYFEDIDQKFRTFMFNAFFDYEVTPKFIPYIGGGIGISRMENTINYYYGDEKLTKDRFSFGFDVGASFALTNNLNLDTGIRGVYLGSMQLEYLGDDEPFDSYSLDIYCGLRITI